MLAAEIMETETFWLDTPVLQLAQHWRQNQPQLEPIMRDLSGLGSTVVLTLLTLATAGYLWVTGHGTRAAMVCISMASGALAVTALKSLFGRVRPDPSWAAFAQDGMSFPSGHASMSAIFFLTVGSLLAQLHARAGIRAYVIGVAALLAACIGFSRVALGVHWATDVLGGWAFGAGWATLWFWAALPLRDRSQGL